LKIHQQNQDTEELKNHILELQKKIEISKKPGFIIFFFSLINFKSNLNRSAFFKSYSGYLF
jgi:hypothetical protein